MECDDQLLRQGQASSVQFLHPRTTSQLFSRMRSQPSTVHPGARGVRGQHSNQASQQASQGLDDVSFVERSGGRPQGVATPRRSANSAANATGNLSWNSDNENENLQLSARSGACIALVLTAHTQYFDLRDIFCLKYLFLLYSVALLFFCIAPEPCSTS